MKKEQRLPHQPIVRLAGIFGMVVLGGCATLDPWSGKRPELAVQTTLNDQEIWRHTLRDWYPGWSPPRHPVRPRETDGAPPASHPDAAPIRARAARPPAGERRASVARSTPTARPLPAPVYDLHRSSPPAAREAFNLIPVDGAAGSALATVGSDYTVRKGDTLSSIAARVYGDANAWRRIFDANRDRLPNPNRITPGVRLRIP
jgi:nucleoid-associated protein YgaU